MIVVIKKRILKPLLVVLAIFVVLGAVGIGLLMAEQDRIVKLAVSELNKQLKGELTIASSDISLFKQFPAISIVLCETKLYPDQSGTSRPILDIDKLFVSVSIADLLAKQYNVRRITLQGGRLDLVQDGDGQLNLLQALDTGAEKPQGPASAFRIDLRKISLKEFGIYYHDLSNDRRIHSRVHQLTSAFHIDSNRVSVQLAGDLELDIKTREDTSYFRHKKIDLDLTSDYRLDTKKLEITKGSFKLEGGAFGLKGTVNLANVPEVNLKVKGEEPDFKLLVAFLPGDIKASLKPFRYDGDIFFEGIVQGELSQEELPYIEVTFGCKDAWFLNKRADKKVDQLAFKGFYTNGYPRSLQSSELHVLNINARPGEGIFKGNFVMRDFTDPKILMQIQSELELKFLGDFFGIRDLQQSTGTIKLEMDFKEIMDMEMPEQSLSKLKEGVQSSLKVANLSFHIPGYPHQIKNLNLRAEMKDGKVTVDTATMRIGTTDLRMSGSLSDVKAFLHDRKKLITLGLNVSSDSIKLKELFSYDTAMSGKLKEEIRRFHVGLKLTTSVDHLLHPSPMPNGQFEISQLQAAFKVYPHAIKDMAAEILIDDSTLQVHSLTGMIDGSDLAFCGLVNNYHLWFNKIKSGHTQIMFDFKSKRFALDDIFMRGYRKSIPGDYRHEELDDVWLNARVNLKYDTIFRFARAEITNITGLFKNHKIQLKGIKGKVKYGTRILVLDTLTGTVGKSDFDLSMRLFTGADKKMNKKVNYFHLRSSLLDVDEIANYDFSSAPRKKKPGEPDRAQDTVAKANTSHAKSFNFFSLPFSDFNVWVDVDQLKYKELWVGNLTGRLRLTEDHFLYVDTVGMKIADGTVSMKGDLNGSDTTRLLFTSTIKVSQLDLEKIMVRLDQFGEDLIVNKNIKGRLSGVIKSKMQVHPNLIPIVGNTTAQLKVNVYDGSLIDFAPMMAMAGYFKDKNLRRVRFDSLKNELSFVNGVLTIPQMNINSSIGAIEMSGKQSLDLSMEYYMRIPVKMVTQVAFNSLFNRKPGTVDSTQVDQIEYLETARKGHFVNLKITGTPSDYKVALGKAKRGG